MTATLHIPQPLLQEIRGDLLSTPHLERAGLGFAGLTDGTADRRLLLREWAPVPQDEYLVQLGYHLEVNPAFWARHTKRARRSGEALVILHSHPGDDEAPDFSPSDDWGEDRLIPKIHARAPVPVAAVVLSPGGERGRLRDPGGRTHALTVRAPEVVPRRAIDGGAFERFDRQVRALGREGQALLIGLKVGIVGAGGLGAHVAQQLIHLGVGRLLVIDPDRVSPSNLSRLVGASRLDAWFSRRKTKVASRLARRLGGPTRVTEVNGSVTDEMIARRLLHCDVIIGCTDNQWSRTVLNALAYQYYVPVVDLGVELQASGAMGGRVSWLTPGSACLWCMNVLDPQRVRAEQVPKATLQDEVARGYLQGIDEPAPAVVSINGVMASLAVTELLARLTGFAGYGARPGLLVYRLIDGTVRRSAPVSNPTCPTCSPTGQLGLGDLGMQPWSSRPGPPNPLDVRS
jgi:molybdopterin/thiamine biosynthesis adenylyltransferase